MNLPGDDIVEKGDSVKLHYTGSVDGKVFDTSYEEEAKKAGIYREDREYKPLELTVGAGQVIKGLDEALQGMKLNEEKEVIVSPEKGYKNPEHPMHGKMLLFRGKSNRDIQILLRC